MKTHNIGLKIILALLIVNCLLCISWLLFRNYFQTTNNENRVLSTMPEFSIENYGSFSSDFSEYFNDNMLLRNSLVTLNSAIDYFVFGSTSNGAIAGKDNWLFFYSKNGCDTIADYSGTNLLSDSELQEIADNCVAQRDFLSSQGVEFVIMIAPDKARIYSEYMPEQYGAPADNYRVKQIVSYLKKNTDIRVVYPYDELMLAKEQLPYNIYYKTDTHWNGIGAYIGTSALVNELGIDLPSITSNQIEIIVGDYRAGDLAGLLNLKEQLKYLDHEYSVVGYNNHNLQTIEADDLNIFHFKAPTADSRKIFIARDSYAISMAPYIGSQFSESFMMHHDCYSYDDYLSQSPDIFVFEVVERDVIKLMSFSIQQRAGQE